MRSGQTLGYGLEPGEPFGLNLQVDLDLSTDDVVLVCALLRYGNQPYSEAMSLPRRRLIEVGQGLEILIKREEESKRKAQKEMLQEAAEQQQKVV